MRRRVTRATGGGILGRAQDLILPMAIIASVLVILVPLPPALLDVLLAANIALSVIVLLTTIYVRTPLEFSIFPSCCWPRRWHGWCSTSPPRGSFSRTPGQTASTPPAAW